MTEYQASHVVRQSDVKKTLCQLPYKIHALSDDECEVICYNVIDRTVLSDEQYADLKDNGHLLPGDLLRVYSDSIWSTSVSVEEVCYLNNTGDVCNIDICKYGDDCNNDVCKYGDDCNNEIEIVAEENNELISLLFSDPVCGEKEEENGDDNWVVNDILFPPSSNQLLSSHSSLVSYEDDSTLVVCRNELSWEF